LRRQKVTQKGGRRFQLFMRSLSKPTMLGELALFLFNFYMNEKGSDTPSLVIVVLPFTYQELAEPGKAREVLTFCFICFCVVNEDN
jgi:hypothetical protein